MRNVVEERIDRAARAMFAVTNTNIEWEDSIIPADLREHYRRLAEAALWAADEADK
jgi:hypothetical protein